MGKKIHLDIYDFCRKVEEDFKSRAAFLEHYRVHQGVEYSCEECDASFLSKFRLEHHERDAHGTVQCNVCDKTFTHESNLYRHKKNHVETSFECQLCKKNFTRKDNLKVHNKKCKPTVVTEEIEEEIQPDPYKCNL